MSPSTGHCIFCDLIRGAAEVSICYEDSIAIAFLDIQPVNPGHVLVVPREHYEVLQDIPKEVGAHLYQVAAKLIPRVQTASGASEGGSGLRQPVASAARRRGVSRGMHPSY